MYKISSLCSSEQEFVFELAVGLVAASNKKSKVILYYTNYYTNDKRACLYTQSTSCHVHVPLFFILAVLYGLLWNKYR